MKASPAMFLITGVILLTACGATHSDSNDHTDPVSTDVEATSTES